jgi:uncharacterized protein
MTAPLANLVTLGAIDLPRLRRFYDALDWPRVVDDADFVAYELRGTVLALFPREKLAADGRVRASDDTGLRFTIGVVAAERDEVDRLTEQMRAAGATVSKPAQDGEFFVGRSAYLEDPEGNFWEIAWAADDNPIVEAAKRAAGAEAG